MIKRTALTLFCLVLLHVSAQSLMAQQAPLSDAEVTERINYIQGVLDQGQTAANVWWYGWLGGYGLLTAGQLGVCHFADDKELRQDMIIGSVTTVIGMFGVIIDDMEPGFLPDRLRVMPGDTPEQRRAKLAAAERYLRECAQREIDGWAWYNHVLAFLVNAGAGLVTWLCFDRPFTDGLINFAIGQVISEIQIFTQPRRAISDLRAYEERYNTAVQARAQAETEWFVTIIPGGVAVGFRY